MPGIPKGSVFSGANGGFINGFVAVVVFAPSSLGRSVEVVVVVSDCDAATTKNNRTYRFRNRPRPSETLHRSDAISMMAIWVRLSVGNDDDAEPITTAAKLETLKEIRAAGTQESSPKNSTIWAYRERDPWRESVHP
ncbi:unnamed protein product [Haemonchus placei]|uniref:Uncharacterized protein n=1 Tax=Haemonchus placei TaxID=6290 RepID=A0A0N4WXI7_HAEPC|nr:unnamed protein product [Haemonchus placei]